jgi:putative pyruvate formate lyase activating enzyme
MSPAVDRVPPSYLSLAESGELESRARRLETLLTQCRLCPHQCRIDRRRETGVCGVGVKPSVSAWAVRRGEEPLLSGSRGSGAVLMAGCTLRCVFCSAESAAAAPGGAGTTFPGKRYLGRELTPNEVAGIFMMLQDRGCHSLNWVVPSHQVAQLVRALTVAVKRGLRLPVVYSSNCYDAAETIRLLDGIVDVYNPSLRYADADTGERVSGVEDYPERAREALLAMYDQVGEEWVLSPDGTLMRGLLIRIEVLPADLAGVERTLRWISSELSPGVAISLVARYRSCHGTEATRSHPLVGRPITADEWRMARWALEQHMHSDRVWMQRLEGE